MRKILTTLCLTLLALTSFQANAELWLIGGISPDGWDTSKGVQFTQVDDNNYTLDLQVNVTGQQYYSLTTRLSTSSGDWDAIKAYRFGGSMEVPLDNPTTLEAGTDASPYTIFSQTGVYTFQFNVSERVLKVSLKNEVVLPNFNGTIYITKNSVGNIWAWDADGNYFEAWPGKPISELETATVNGHEYFSFTYTHNTTGPGLIFNDGTSQTSDLVPEDGKLYNYTGGNTVEKTDPASDTTVVTPASLSLRGSFNEWGETPMTQTEDGKWTITQEMEAGAEFKFFNEKGEWISADSRGVFIVTQEQVENGTRLKLLVGAGGNFRIPVAGTWTLTVDTNELSLVISGEWKEPKKELYLIGSFNEWSTETQEALTPGQDGKWSITKELPAGVEFKFRDEKGNWIGAESVGNFIVTKEQVENGDLLTLGLGDAYQNFQIPVAGTWTFTVDPDSMKLVIGGEWNEETPEKAFYLIGSFNEWSEDTQEALTLGQDGKWTITKAMEAGAEFKLRDELGNWIGAVSDGNFIVTKGQVEEGTLLALLAGDSGQNFQIPVAGTWTLTVDPDSMKLVISGEWIEDVEFSKVFILGDVNNQGGWFPNVGVEMATTDGVNYTATITTAGENEGYSYFGFTTKLSENDYENGGWEEIDPYRFGAVSEGNFLVTDELLNTQLSLTTENPQAFQIPAGNYKLALDLEAFTLTITRGLIRGDLNNDGQVDVTDVSLLIDVVLGKTVELADGAEPDLNGDGLVDVTDVSMIIDIVLGK